MAGPSIGDVWRIYVKPSMKGRLIVRKKTVNRKSAKVIERNRKLQEKKLEETPAHMAWKKCTEEEPYKSRCTYTTYVYVNGQRKEYKRCAWPCFVRLLRLAWKEAGLAGEKGVSR